MLIFNFRSIDYRSSISERQLTIFYFCLEKKNKQKKDKKTRTFIDGCRFFAYTRILRQSVY